MGINGTGRLSTQKYPMSSSIFKAVDFPAPDIPVTITNLIGIPLHFVLEFSQAFYLRFQIHTRIFLYFSLYLTDQLRDIGCGGLVPIDHKSAVLL